MPNFIALLHTQAMTRDSLSLKNLTGLINFAFPPYVYEARNSGRF